MPSQRHRDRYVNPHHPYFDTTTKLAGDIAITCIASNPIGKSMTIYQSYRIGKIIDPHTCQHRTKDFLLVNLHVWTNVIKESRPDKKALLMAGRSEERRVGKERRWRARPWGRK